MEQTCIKCESVMVKAKVDSHTIRVYNSAFKANSKTLSEVSPCFVCPNCGFIELYALNPERLI
ncbi:hypothetical protein GCM10011389_22390 [Pontibacillus salipaludis]|uniref:Nucleic acid-binding protein n=1 Tax=Pontibacillus salipaludis TaxID=1697394 RepID=A0ABQ1Q569_9BACI|nr:hypothetical protein GCM10011389_22390 [Pontibacillus salipaludis]